MMYLSICLGFIIIAVLAITPLTLESQLLFGVTGVILAAVLMPKKNTARKNIFAALVLAVSGRYIYWRITETMAFQSVTDAIFGWGMFAAELYFLCILAGSFLQNVAMRERKPEALPADTSKWPTVDVFIPTYNEPLDIVKVTTIAAKGIDWPKDKVNIYLLDDGRRDEFKSMAESLGVGYIARSDNKGAKAGNLNNALTHTNGELVTIFDCDHVPTRSFLQATVGWFLRDSKLALMQTPHHFYNEDPFEKNLHTGNDAPNEGLLFYGMVQDGNDFWNASFFCGSCAILRREAIYDVGGFATETVTEDAHTSLRLHQKGWNSAFLKIPQASGLATESLRAHVGQRLRWGRGMLQIFRTENPFIIPDLTLSQRFCYASAMLHFFFPLPRIVLLTAPLAFLLFGVNIIVTSPQAVVAYALPHIVVAVMASLYMQARFRQVFATEVYETMLAFHLIGPMIITLINPKLGKFNVTDKGAVTDDSYFDWKIVAPQIVVTFILILSIVYSLSNTSFDGLNITWTLALNIIWAILSIIFLLLSIAVALEKGERRSQHRVNINQPIRLQLASGHMFPAVLKNMSLSGACIELVKNKTTVHFSRNSSVYFDLPYSDSSLTIDAKLLNVNGQELKVSFSNDENKDVANRVKGLFGRADAWAGWDDVTQRGFLNAGISMMRSIFHFLHWCLTKPFSKSDTKNESTNDSELSGESSNQTRRLLSKMGDLGQLSTLGLGILLFIGAAFPQVAQAQQIEGVVSDNGSDIEIQMTRSYNIELNDVGVTEPILLQGDDRSRAFSFSLRSDEVVSSALMKLRLSVSPGLDPQNSQLTVVINGEIVHSLALNPDFNGLAETEFSIPPYVMLLDNSLEFRVHARKLGQEAQEQRNDKSVWIQISNASSMTLNVNRLPLSLDLSNLPVPFFDKRDHAELVLPFSFAARPSPATTQAASIVASYWGSLASFRRASFPVLFGEIPTGNGIVFITQTERPAGFEDISIDGPALELIYNPRDVVSQLLLVKGRDTEELLIAAQALSTGDLLVSGNAIDVTRPVVQERGYYDAPAWLPSNRPITFGEIEEAADLEGYGLKPGLLTVNFKMAPDIFLWSSDGIPVNLNFRYPGSRWFDLKNSRMDVLLNDNYITSVPLSKTESESFVDGDYVQNSWQLTIPPYLIYGENQLQFYFDLKTRVSEQNYHLLPGRVRVAIDSDSSIDMSSAYRYSRMPNLAYLAQSGLPFSKKADLSETIVVSPEGGFSKHEMQALFTLVGNIAGKTGYPALGIKVTDWQNIEDYKNHDFLVVGNFDNQPLLQLWSEVSPLKFDGTHVSVSRMSSYSKFRYKFKNLFTEEDFNPDQVVLPRSSITASLYAHQSPLNPQRTVVNLISSEQDGLVRLADTLKSSEKSASIKGDFFVLNEREVLSFTTSEPYFVGELPWYIMLQWYISSHPWLIPVLLIVGVLLLGLSALAKARIRAKRLLSKRNDFLASQESAKSI